MEKNARQILDRIVAGNVGVFLTRDFRKIYRKEIVNSRGNSFSSFSEEFSLNTPPVLPGYSSRTPS